MLLSKLRLRQRAYRTARAWRIRISALANGSVVSTRAILDIDEGASVQIGRGVRIMPECHIFVGSKAILKIGDNTNIARRVTVFCGQSIEIGERCRLSHGVSVIDHDYDFHRPPPFFENVKKTGPVDIGHDVWIGADSFIMRGVSIGGGSVVGANSTIAKSVPDRSLTFTAREQIVKQLPKS